MSAQGLKALKEVHIETHRMKGLEVPASDHLELTVFDKTWLRIMGVSPD